MSAAEFAGETTMRFTPDVIVIGAALNGLAAALALGGDRTRRPLDVLLVDARDPRGYANASFDGRDAIRWAT